LPLLSTRITRGMQGDPGSACGPGGDGDGLSCGGKPDQTTATRSPQCAGRGQSGKTGRGSRSFFRILLVLFAARKDKKAEPTEKLGCIIASDQKVEVRSRVSTAKCRYYCAVNESS
jgi:hypothetical protein